MKKNLTKYFALALLTLSGGSMYGKTQAEYLKKYESKFKFDIGQKIAFWLENNLLNSDLKRLKPDNNFRSEIDEAKDLATLQDIENKTNAEFDFLQKNLPNLEQYMFKPMKGEETFVTTIQQNKEVLDKAIKKRKQELSGK